MERNVTSKHQSVSPALTFQEAENNCAYMLDLLEIQVVPMISNGCD